MPPKKIVPNSVGEVGNTNPSPPSKKQVNKAIKWVFTYNNYDPLEIVPIVSTFEQYCSKYIFQEETGEEGTPHLQGSIWLKVKMRPTELKLSKKIHWSLMKDEIGSLLYCSKEDTRTGKIYKSKNIIIPKPLNIITTLRPFQQSLENILLEEPNDRSIIWVADRKGSIGKSAFCKYLVHKYDALYITEGKKSDIINLVYNYCEVSKKYLTIVILDVPRENGNNISYKSLEEIKNGLICNTKYETGNTVINPPHIVVFANEYPDNTKWTSDRYQVYDVDDNYTLLTAGLANAPSASSSRYGSLNSQIASIVY